MMVREIKPPTTPAEVRKAPEATQAIKTKPQQAQMPMRATEGPILPQAMLMLNATVYDGPQSHVSWQYEGVKHSLVLPLDWHAVAEIKQLQTPQAGFMLLHTVSNAPAGTQPPNETWANLDDPTLCEPLLSLLAQYRIEQTSLNVKAQRRAALNAARERYNLKNPPQPETHILNFYDSSATPQQTQP
jgi:hypothetical protein